MIDSHIIKVMVCPYCHSLLTEDNNKMTCSGCRRTYTTKRGIPDFRDKDGYWCNVSREKMQNLNRRAVETGNWFQSAKEVIPEYSNHFTYFYRADCQFLWPTNKDSIILDAGSMWGGITIPAAQFHREVYAVDKTLETLEFLKIRAEQMGFRNIHTVAAPVKSLPFADSLFDLVILNGVLEWVGLEEDTILEQHWKGTRNEKQVYSQTPEEMQINVLKEARRVLKPNGCLYVAIENRYGIQYFLTHPDDHNNVRFITFLPRYLANTISKIMGKGEYRTYIYSPKQLDTLLRRSGFNVNLMYGVSPHYIHIKKAFPLSLTRYFKDEVQINGIIPRVLHRIVWPLIPKYIAPHIIPSLAFICRKNKGNELIPRIKGLLIEANVIQGSDRYHFVISNNRFENSNSANIIIYDYNNNPLYFCKIARDLQRSGLQAEADNLKWISNNLLALRECNIQIPELIYVGVVDDIMIFVTTYLNIKKINIAFHYIMNRGFDRAGITNRFIRKNTELVDEKLFIKKIDSKIRQAINSLMDFQYITSNGKSYIRDIVNNVVDKYLERHQENLPDEIEQICFMLKDRIKSFEEIKVLTCSVHGDYDFDNILFFSDGRIGLIDFEHFERNGSPFFDLVTLIFNPLIIKWRSSYFKNESFAIYLKQYGTMKYVIKWLQFYCDKQSLPYSIIPLIPLIAAVEQNVKVYPPFRDPNTYPMYGEDMIKEFILLNIDEE